MALRKNASCHQHEIRPDGHDIARVDKTLASERFDFKDVVNMVYRPSGIHSDLEGGADCEMQHQHEPAHESNFPIRPRPMPAADMLSLPFPKFQIPCRHCAVSAQSCVPPIVTDDSGLDDCSQVQIAEPGHKGVGCDRVGLPATSNTGADPGPARRPCPRPGPRRTTVNGRA